MAQSDQSVQDATFPSVRADINDNFAALFSQSSGNSAPSVTVAFQPWVDTSSNPPVYKMRNGSNSAWITVGVLDPAGFSVSGSPTGQVIYVALSSAPTGYLKANGAAVSRTTYAALFAAIGTTFGVGDGSTTFNVPDLRGEFIRGWADDRAVDTGRAFGSAQGESFASHSHTTPTGLAVGVGFDAFYGTSSESGPNATGLFQASGTNTVGGTETRPRNIALLACIKF
jgi:phage-related tail fiber protein